MSIELIITSCWPHPPHQQCKRAETVFRIVQEWGRETSWEEVSPHNCTAIASEHDKQLQRVRLQTADCSSTVARVGMAW